MMRALLGLLLLLTAGCSGKKKLPAPTADESAPAHSVELRFDAFENRPALAIRAQWRGQFEDGAFVSATNQLLSKMAVECLKGVHWNEQASYLFRLDLSKGTCRSSAELKGEMNECMTRYTKQIAEALPKNAPSMVDLMFARQPGKDAMAPKSKTELNP